MILKPEDKNRLLSALTQAMEIVKASPEARKCTNCINWRNGCKLADGRMPPQHVQEQGCKSWQWDGVPF